MGEYYAIVKTGDCLEHHGILGMKWGVRRYQNYDGSYTRAGMKRYNTSMEKYESSKKMYENLKKSNINAEARSGLEGTSEYYKKKGDLKKAKYYSDEAKKLDGNPVSKSELNKAKENVKNAKKQLNKDYDHLKKDKMADKGKARYQKGQTITGTAAVTAALATVGSITLSGAMYTKGNTQKALIGIGAAAVATAMAKQGYEEFVVDPQLRAYYSHTSKY